MWLPPAAVRDERELPRTRMAMVRIRTNLKNRVHATLAKFGLSPAASDVFSQKGRTCLEESVRRLPPETRSSLELELELLDQLQTHIEVLEARIRERIQLTPAIQLLKTLPGVGNTLSVGIASEVGSVARFPSRSHFASYAGTTPKVNASGGKTRYGPMRHEANPFLKWAFIEAANVVVIIGGRSPPGGKRDPRRGGPGEIEDSDLLSEETETSAPKKQRRVG